MATADVLIPLANSIRGDTRRYLSSCPTGHLTWSPPGTSNHLLWHAGHALWLQDVLGLEPMTGKSYLPSGWRELFGQHSRPLAAAVDWPTPAEVDALLARQLELWVEAVRQTPEARWTDRQRNPRNGWPLLPGVLHGLHDEAKHQGEMYLLLKMQRQKE